MENKQEGDVRKEDKNHISILTDAVMKVVRKFRITRRHVDFYISVLQEESIVEGFGPDKEICNIVDDPEILSSVAKLIYAEIVSDLSLQFERRYQRPDKVRKVLRYYIQDNYHTEEDPAFYIDYGRLRIMSGLNYEQQANNRRTRYDVKKVFSLKKSELSKSLSKYNCESKPVICGLIQLLMGPREDEVRSIYERLLRMNKRELKSFHDNLSYRTENKAIHDLVHLFYGP